MSYTIKEALKIGAEILNKAQIESHNIDSRILLANALSITTEELISKASDLVPEESFKKFMGIIDRRSHSEPISYILGKKEFYSIDFVVDQNVLIPRPDSEVLIDTILKFYPTDSKIKILDLGTGSGCLLLTALKYLQNASGVAVDIEEGAINICKANYDALQLPNQIQFIRSSWEDLPFKEEFDLIISNPPYISQSDIEILQPDVKEYEPLVALSGGKDGLSAYRVLAPIIQRFLKKSGIVVLECGVGQHIEISKIMEYYGLLLDQYIKDLGGRVRCLKLKKKEDMLIN